MEAKVVEAAARKENLKEEEEVEIRKLAKR